jgi:hypothetical protein
MPEPDTICGYGLADVRRSLRDAIDRRDRRAANRWTAELVATPGAIGSLWASYWLAWAAAQAGPTIPILLRQMWGSATELAAEHLGPTGEGWAAFRNDPEVRALTAEATSRLLSQPRQSPVVWPTKEIVLYDVSVMRDAAPPPAADGPVVLRAWRRDEDSMELRMMAGRFLAALEAGDIRSALSAIAWTMLPQAQQALPMPLKIGERGPGTLTAKQRACPIWFWLEIGRSYLTFREGLHRGWPTFHTAVAEAFRLNYKRWTAVDRLRVVLAWVLQLRAAGLPQPESLWVAPPLQQTLAEIDLPYKEIAAELANPQVVVQPATASEKTAKQAAADTKKASQARIEAKMAEADAAVLAALGLSESDL